MKRLLMRLLALFRRQSPWDGLDYGAPSAAGDDARKRRDGEL